jgi:hypothetical protein
MYVAAFSTVVLECVKAVPLLARHAGAKGEKIYLLRILDPGIRWGEWSAPRPGRTLPPGKDPLVPIRIGGFVGLKADLDTEA